MALLFGEKNVSPAYSTSFEAACFEVTFVPMVLPLPEIQQLQMHGGCPPHTPLIADNKILIKMQ